MDTTWQISPILERYFGGASYLLVTALACGLLAGWVLGILFTRIPTWRRVVLASLRIVTILLLMVAMLRPERVYTELQKQSATLAILIDQSRSMTLDDSLQGVSRWQLLRDSLEKCRQALAGLARDVDLRCYAFDEATVAVTQEDGRLALADRPAGEQSAYGRAMREVLRREDGKRLIGFILAGDGAQQTPGIDTDLPENAARQLAQQNCPLYTVSFGGRQRASQARDVIVESMPDDLAVFAKNRLTVTGTMRASGYVHRDLPLQLIVLDEAGNEKIVATESYRPARDGEQIRYQLGYVPQQPGEYKLIVRAVAQEGEATTSNNELPTYLTVLAGGLRVLYLQGELRREQRFLRRALASSPDIDVTLLTLHTRNRDRWPTDVSRYFEPGAFDVYILGDLDSAAFRPGQVGGEPPADLELLARTVQQGAGLLALGGWHAFRPGGYHKTPLAQVMPVPMDARVDRFVRQNFGEKIDTTLHWQGPLQMLPAEPWGTRHYLMQLAARPDNMAAWRKLPPLTGANKFRGVRDGAEVLAEDQHGHPLLVAGQPGGRVLAFAGDSTWRWVMQGESDAHRRFWRQAILWLARKDEVGEGSVWIRLDSRRYLPGQRVTFATGARSPAGDPLPRANLTATIVHPDGSQRPLRLVRQGEHFRGAATDCTQTGSYTVQVVARDEGQELGQHQSRFMVYLTDRELSGVTADPTLLQNLAAQTGEYGGRALTPEELPALLEELSQKPLQLEEKVKLTVTYWDRGYLLLLLVGVLSTEWFLRKKWKLV
ncbi:MAG: hypothetical protein GTO53_05620 [Planctomycetales bacterium]|nr:hypothetical protein [Planctomycetales bacterium]NIM08627.1 hypothetical protein [Planctomycetales bacterium]NIN08095.1 hypothetical protein [Planctomycetales bacterium]NIN76810.1 hypothetical protein [Planctomycetales bacterium]NIO34408.1 hypothetical protein [Planctomycetales bacterium]